MGVNFENTSEGKSFNNIFDKISSEKIECNGQTNSLNIYIIKIHDKLFSYEKLYDYILDNICQYVFSRRNNKNSRKLILEALDHLRKINSEKDSGAGGELGEILLYLFLEQDLKAPKLFSKVELKTSTNDYIKGSDGIHFKFRETNDRKKILQLVIGEAKINNDIKDGINNAFKSINQYVTDNTQDIRLLDKHIMDQLIDDNEAKILIKYLLGDDVEPYETVFGVFIGYSINYDENINDNDTYKTNIKNETLRIVSENKENIERKIKEYKISNHEFNFYFLPFHNAERDRKEIIDQLTKKESKFSWGGIRNG